MATSLFPLRMLTGSHSGEGRGGEGRGSGFQGELAQPIDKEEADHCRLTFCPLFLQADRSFQTDKKTHQAQFFENFWILFLGSLLSLPSFKLDGRKSIRMDALVPPGLELCRLLRTPGYLSSVPRAGLQAAYTRRAQGSLPLDS